MTGTAKQHYDQLLGAHYRWTVAGDDDPFAPAAAWLARHGLDRAASYLDLGAGFGAHAVPLARAGAAVTAVDFHAGLLEELRAAAPAAETVEADLVAYVEAAAVARAGSAISPAAAPSRIGTAPAPDAPTWVVSAETSRTGSTGALVGGDTAPARDVSANNAPAGSGPDPAGGAPTWDVSEETTESSSIPPRSWGAVLCLGDTLTHLSDHDTVERLVISAARVLVPGGFLALSYRDYSAPPRTGTDRFIPVRQDAHRALVCCIDLLDADRISVTDLITTIEPDGLRTQISAYPKLRLAPTTVAAWAAAAGLTLEHEASERGLLIQRFRAPA